MKFNSVKEELLHLAEISGGRLNPKDVVDYAADPETHLHSRFTWDDTKAAEEYRLWQARRVISLEFEVIHLPDKSQETRLFVSLVEDRKPDGGYRLVTEVLSDAELRQKLIEEALGEFRRVRIKYSTIKELAGIFAAIDEVEAG